MCKLLKALTRAGIINSCHINPACCWLYDHLPRAVIEDWKPPGDLDATPESVESISAAAVRSADSLYGHLDSYWIDKDGVEPRMSTTGMAAQASGFEVTEDPTSIFCLFDLVMGILVADRNVNPHKHPPQTEELVRKFFARVLFYAVCENPDYYVVNLKSAIVREAAVEWSATQGGKAARLTDPAWLRWAGVSTAEACENGQMWAWLHFLPPRDAQLPESIVIAGHTIPLLPAREHRPAMVQVWVSSQQGSRNACLGATSGALRQHAQEQLERSMFGRPQRRFSPASPLYWVINSMGREKAMEIFGIRFLTSSQAGGEAGSGQAGGEAVEIAWERYHEGLPLTDAQQKMVDAQQQAGDDVAEAWDRHNQNQPLSAWQQKTVDAQQQGGDDRAKAWDRLYQNQPLSERDLRLTRTRGPAQGRVQTPGCRGCEDVHRKHSSECPRGDKSNRPAANYTLSLPPPSAALSTFGPILHASVESPALFPMLSRHLSSAALSSLAAESPAPLSTFGPILHASVETSPALFPMLSRDLPSAALSTPNSTGPQTSTAAMRQKKKRRT